MRDEHGTRHRYAYRIRVQGVLAEDWADWFDGFTITPAGSGETLLVGTVPDQPALHGVIDKIGGLGLVLLSVERLSEDD